jgi:hypothetical protein
MEVHAAPINPAELLTSFLFHPEDDDGNSGGRTVICTSATLATGGHFHHFKARCGIKHTGEEHVLPAVFNYGEQALLYQPALPAYDYTRRRRLLRRRRPRDRAAAGSEPRAHALPLHQLERLAAGQ